MSAPLIRPGQRAIAAGRTGSGKSTLACWFLNRAPGNWLILNPKNTAAYDDLPDAVKVNSLDFDKIEKAMQKHRFVIINPNSREANYENMDAFIMRLHESYSHIGLCCDELYTLHNGARAGPGLLGWLTRGRELKQSFFGLTQRPAWLSQFLFSESDYIIGMALNLKGDRKRMVEMTGHDQFEARVPERNWLFYDVARDKLKYFGPVPLDI